MLTIGLDRLKDQVYDFLLLDLMVFKALALHQYVQLSLSVRANKGRSLNASTLHTHHAIPEALDMCPRSLLRQTRRVSESWSHESAEFPC